MQVIKSFTAIAHIPEELEASKEMPRYTKKFWDETKEAMSEIALHEKASGKVWHNLSLAQAKKIKNSKVLK